MIRKLIVGLLTITFPVWLAPFAILLFFGNVFRTVYHIIDSAVDTFILKKKSC